MSGGISTLIASANLTRADGRPSARGGFAFDELSIGQNLKLRVLKQIDQQRYEVSFGSRRHVVESRVPLEPGTQVHARVEGKGDRLELRYLALDGRFADEAAGEEKSALAPADGLDGQTPASTWLAELAKQYRLPLDARAMATIEESAAVTGQPQLMAQAGMFLQKLAHHVRPDDLAAVYRALSGEARAVPVNAPVSLDSLRDAGEAADALADHLDAASNDAAKARVPTLDARAEEGACDDGRRALRLLNLQDEGSVAWRYGTLPILVGGRLVELDLVMFRERQPGTARSGLRRLVMTLETTHFGRVRVEARALDERILVKLQASTAAAVETMSAYGADVRAAIERLGWQVDEVAYEVETDPARAAQAVIDHVLAAGSVDREL